MAVVAPAGSENMFRAQIIRGMLGNRRSGDSCSVRRIAQPEREAQPVPTPSGTKHVLLRLKDHRRPSRVVARWHEASQATAVTLNVDKVRPVRFDGQVAGWMALIAIPPQSDGRMTAKVAWPDAADCLKGPDWLVGAVSFERV